MRAIAGPTSSNAVEARHRLSTSINGETNKRRVHEARNTKDADKGLRMYSIQEKLKGNNLWKHTLIILLVFIIVLAFYAFLGLPIHTNIDTLSDGNTMLNKVKPAWTKKPQLDERYLSSLELNRDDIIKVMTKLPTQKELKGVGLLNFNDSEINCWKELLPSTKHIVLDLKPVPKNTTWETLYPEWIDEEEETEVPLCTTLPSIKISDGGRNHDQIDLIAVKLPCNKSSGKWSRDIGRLHLQLATARLAASVNGTHDVYVLLVTDCFPIPNLFTCTERASNMGFVWLYKPNRNTLREKTRHLPVGSCELSIPTTITTKEYYRSSDHQRVAYATILHSTPTYVCGAIAVAQSIRMSGSTIDLVILVDESINGHHRAGLKSAGWKIHSTTRIRNPKAKQASYNEWNYSKFRLWQLTQYDKIVFIDADMLILKNIDFLFNLPEISAIGNNATLFNSGVMVIEPSECTFQLLMDHINEIKSYNGGDQGYLNEIFTWWHRIPSKMNYLKYNWEGSSPETLVVKAKLFSANPPQLFVLHYLGLKPWMCFRDYDCNWNIGSLHKYASDEAHTTWWKVHDMMPKNLQSYCYLKTKQKAGLEWNRLQAQKGNYSDGHWKRKIRDPRLKICRMRLCDWEIMLRHWGKDKQKRKSYSSSLTANPTLSLSS